MPLITALKLQPWRNQRASDYRTSSISVSAVPGCFWSVGRVFECWRTGQDPDFMKDGRIGGGFEFRQRRRGEERWRDAAFLWKNDSIRTGYKFWEKELSGSAWINSFLALQILYRHAVCPFGQPLCVYEAVIYAGARTIPTVNHRKHQWSPTDRKQHRHYWKQRERLTYTEASQTELIHSIKTLSVCCVSGSVCICSSIRSVNTFTLTSKVKFKVDQNNNPSF